MLTSPAWKPPPQMLEVLPIKGQKEGWMAGNIKVAGWGTLRVATNFGCLLSRASHARVPSMAAASVLASLSAEAQ